MTSRSAFPLAGSPGCWGQAAALLVSSHVMDEAARCDILLFMRDGRFLAAASPAEILQRTGEPDLESAFLALAASNRRAVHR
jgi:ABC-2 type transport system ATP-binding protein